MIRDSFFLEAASTWFLLLVAAGIFAFGMGLRAVFDGRKKWELIACIIAVIVCMILAILVLIPYLL